MRENEELRTEIETLRSNTQRVSLNGSGGGVKAAKTGAGDNPHHTGPGRQPPPHTHGDVADQLYAQVAHLGEPDGRSLLLARQVLGSMPAGGNKVEALLAAATRLYSAPAQPEEPEPANVWVNPGPIVPTDDEASILRYVRASLESVASGH